MSETKSGIFELVLDESVRHEDKIPYLPLKNALEDPLVQEIVLVFVGTKHMLEDSVLAISTLLKERRPGVILTSKVYSSLGTPDLLLYLESDRRQVANPHAHFLFRCTPPAPPPFDEEVGMFGLEPCRKGIRAMDRQTILTKITEYVDLGLVLDKPQSVGEMMELGLVDGGAIDQVLQKCMGAAL